jgi:transposase InsO family protein
MIYKAIKELLAENKHYSIASLCKIGNINRAAYYKWLNHKDSTNDELNKQLTKEIEQIHDEHPDMGYRRIRDSLAHYKGIEVNDKRVLRICRNRNIQSFLKGRYNCCTKPSLDPAYVAENVLNREFKADNPNEKWVTDVTEFKYGSTLESVHKLYLSTIFDLCDKRPVAYVLSDHNDNNIVNDTFDLAVEANPGAHPLFHSDRGYQVRQEVAWYIAERLPYPFGVTLL